MRGNLRWNPFGELDAPTWADAALVAPRELDAANVTLVVGPPGRGKTTHLLAWHDAWGAGPSGERAGERARFVRIPLAATRLPPEASSVPPGVALLVDEAYALDEASLTALCTHPGPLVIAMHEPRLLPTRRPVVVHRVGGLTAERLVAIARRRIDLARRGPGSLPGVSVATAASLVALHGDDIRAIFHALYELFQRREGPADGEL